ncbi:nucleotidyltransferase domain-containing protein [Thermodesulfovibrio hydrogeniphilus]
MLDDIFKKYNVKIAYLFGSQMKEGLKFLKGEKYKVKKGSDLDIGVVFEELPTNKISVYGDLYIELSKAFDPFEIDLVFLQETDSLFQYEAIKGMLIYSEDEEFLENYEEIVMKKAEDLSFKQKEIFKDFLEAIKDGYRKIELK